MAKASNKSSEEKARDDEPPSGPASMPSNGSPAVRTAAASGCEPSQAADAAWSHSIAIRVGHRHLFVPER